MTPPCPWPPRCKANRLKQIRTNPEAGAKVYKPAACFLVVSGIRICCCIPSFRPERSGVEESAVRSDQHHAAQPTICNQAGGPAIAKNHSQTSYAFRCFHNFAAPVDALVPPSHRVKESRLFAKGSYDYAFDARFNLLPLATHGHAGRPRTHRLRSHAQRRQ